MRMRIHPTHPQGRLVKQAVEILERGGLIIYPTDTVYGLGCGIRQRKALDRLYQLKRMARGHPVSLVCANLSNIAKYAYVEDSAYRIMRRLVPGPYTFILPASREVPRLLLHKRKNIGIRVPGHPVAQALLEALDDPMISTSASLEGEIIHDPDELASRFRQVDALLDAGPGGLTPSTVINLCGAQPEVVRAGAGPFEL